MLVVTQTWEFPSPCHTLGFVLMESSPEIICSYHIHHIDCNIWDFFLELVEGKGNYPQIAELFSLLKKHDRFWLDII
jgi:hypothetical protein